MAANLEFTDDENKVIHDSTFFNHKKNVTKKIVAGYGQLNEAIESLLLQYTAALPQAIYQKKGKINKGENYNDAPYITLDNPRVFAIEHVFAFRTMFLWGNFFSCTVQLAGDYFETFKPMVTEFIKSDKNNSYYIGTGDDQWQHHFSADHYATGKEVLFNRDLMNKVIQKSFFKAAVKIPLNHAAVLNTEALGFYKTFLDFYTAKNQILL